MACGRGAGDDGWSVAKLLDDRAEVFGDGMREQWWLESININSSDNHEPKPEHFLPLLALRKYSASRC